MESNSRGHKLDYSEKSDEYFGTPRLGPISMLPKNIKNILEVGAGYGATLAYIKDHWGDVTTVAVEPFPDAAAIALTRVDVMLEEKIENLTINDFPDAPFDVILCLDVLEHLVDPWSTIQKLTQLLAPGGHIVISVPNINHFSSLFALLFRGQWDLKDEGILDRTHLRFFVKKTAIELAKCSGLELVGVRTSLYNGTGSAAILNNITLGLFERFLSPQYYVSVRSIG